MLTVEVQLHGYRQGHELLAASALLARADQAVVDRLSDVAGPLRPGESFSPYLSTYPLPSGQSQIVARTWGDASAPRAGCVRTVSLIVPAQTWAATPAPDAFVDALSALDPFGSFAGPVDVDDGRRPAMRAITDRNGAELVEALFLEEGGPVAVFDEPDPELLAMRLVVAAWPSLRRRLAVSSFALSPRSVSGRSFDVVFAPKDARHKFADWTGRRIDGRGDRPARHRWTGPLADGVLRAPRPALLDEGMLRLLGAEATEDASALRLALTWRELNASLGTNPMAALGLIDLASTRMRGDRVAIAALAPALTQALEAAAATYPEAEAWDFVGAMSRKLRDLSLPGVVERVQREAGRLAGVGPAAAVAFLDGTDPDDAALAPAIAAGIGHTFDASSARALEGASVPTLARLVRGDPRLARSMAGEPTLVAPLAAVLERLDASSVAPVRDALLPSLTEGFQADVARPLIRSLDRAGALDEVRHLLDVNDMAAAGLAPDLAARLRELGALAAAREELVDRVATPGRDGMLAATLAADPSDLAWVVSEPRLGSSAGRLLRDLVGQADEGCLRAVASQGDLAGDVLRRLPDDAIDAIGRVLAQPGLHPRTVAQGTLRLLRLTSDWNAPALARRALDRCLASSFMDDGPAIGQLLGLLGHELDVPWLVRGGFGRWVDARVADRNMLALDGLPTPARDRVVSAFAELAQAVVDHGSICLGREAAEGCARLVQDALARGARDAPRAAALLLDAALRSRAAPVSPLVAACFPFVYRELARQDEVAGVLWFLPFIDWDRCKAARRALVEAFLDAPSWDPADFALAACHSNDAERLVRRLARTDGGAYLDRLRTSARDLPEACGDVIANALAQVG